MLALNFLWALLVMVGLIGLIWFSSITVRLVVFAGLLLVRVNYLLLLLMILIHIFSPQVDTVPPKRSFARNEKAFAHARIIGN